MNVLLSEVIRKRKIKAAQSLGLQDITLLKAASGLSSFTDGEGSRKVCF